MQASHLDPASSPGIFQMIKQSEPIWVRNFSRMWLHSQGQALVCSFHPPRASTSCWGWTDDPAVSISSQAGRADTHREGPVPTPWWTSSLATARAMLFSGKGFAEITTF